MSQYPLTTDALRARCEAPHGNSGKDQPNDVWIADFPTACPAINPLAPW